MLPHTSFIYAWGGRKIDELTRNDIKDCLKDRNLGVRTVVILHFGTNNIGARNVSTRQAPEHFVREMALLLNELYLYENVSIVVSSILPRPTYELITEIETANTLLETFCKNFNSPNVKFVRSYRSFRDLNNESYVVKRDLFSDNIHLNDKGARKLAENFSTIVHHARFL